MREVKRLLYFSAFILMTFIIMLGRAGAQETDKRTVLNAFGFFKANSAQSKQAWFQLDQKARQALSEGDIAQSESYWKEAVSQAESSSNVYPGMVNCMIGLSMLYHSKNNFGESDRIYELAMRNMEGLVGRSSPDYAKQLPDLAWLYLKHGKPDKAEHILKQSAKINETAYGSKSKQYLESLREYADFMRSENRSNEVSLLELQIKKIEEHLAEVDANTQNDPSVSSDPSNAVGVNDGN